MSEMSQQESDLWSELNDIQMDVWWKVIDLKNAKWDAPTLKSELSELVEQGLEIQHELDKIGAFDD